MDLTILVPTKNRFYYINKLINYYSTINFSGKIFILDSSDELIREKIKEKIRETKNITIEYVFSPGYPCALMKKYINHVSTDYVVFSGDDDYFIYSGIRKNLDFLKANKDFIGCTGEGLSVHSLEDKKKINYILDYRQAKIIGSTSTSRLSTQFQDYKVPIFSIFRKEYFKKFLEPIPSYDDFKEICPDKTIADEYIIEAAMVAYGKIQHLDHPYLVRHIHAERDIEGVIIGHNQDWIKSAGYEKSTNYFFKAMATIISEIDKIENHDAEVFFKKMFQHHVSEMIASTKQSFVKKFIYKIFSIFNPLRKLRYSIIKNTFSRGYKYAIANNEYKKILHSIEGKK